MAATPRSTESGRITVPKLNRDPVQSLRPLSVEVSIAGRDLTIPALSAADWLTVLMVGDIDLSDVFPGLLNEAETEVVEDAIISGKLNLAELEEIIYAIIEMASARPWWVTLRLVEFARTSWDVLGGELGLRGVDPTQISLSHWLDILLLVAIKNMEPKDVQMFTLKLEAPPPTAKTQEDDMEMSESAFMAMAR